MMMQMESSTPMSVSMMMRLTGGIGEVGRRVRRVFAARHNFKPQLARVVSIETRIMSHDKHESSHDNSRKACVHSCIRILIY